VKPLRKTPDNEVHVRILTLTKKGKSKEDIAEIVSLPDTQFRRHMAALVDRGLLTYDRRRRVWVTTDKGYRFLKS
jgi:predicted ArsR family transcriptional regulator